MLKKSFYISIIFIAFSCGNDKNINIGSTYNAKGLISSTRLYFVNELEGFSFGYGRNAQIYYTKDGGHNWEKIEVIEDCYFSNNQFAVSDSILFIDCRVDLNLTDYKILKFNMQNKQYEIIDYDGHFYFESVVKKIYF